MKLAISEQEYRVVLGDLRKDENGKTIQDIFELVKDPEFMSTEELRELKPVATVIHTSNDDRRNFPDAPSYMVHFPTQSREERKRFLEIVELLNPFAAEI